MSSREAFKNDLTRVKLSDLMVSKSKIDEILRRQKKDEKPQLIGPLHKKGSFSISKKPESIDFNKYFSRPKSQDFGSALLAMKKNPNPFVAKNLIGDKLKEITSVNGQPLLSQKSFFCLIQRKALISTASTTCT